jgi:predicted phage-related endonuclease
MIEQRTITDRSEWLRWRKADVTASVVGALFGAHPYVTALRLYAEKRGTEFVDLDDDNKTLRRGRWLEPAVAKAVAELMPQWTIAPAEVYLRDGELRLGCTPDFYIAGDARGLGILQCKTCAPSVYARDWDSGAEVPLWVLLQAATEMLLADAAFGAVAVMLVDAHALDVKVIELPRNPAAEEKIKTAVAAFWQMVAEGKEPEPDFGRDLDVIKAMRPREIAGKVADLSGNNELPGMLERRAAISQRIKEDEAAIDAINAEIMFLLGDAEAATGLNGWRVTYKTQHRSAYTVPAKDLRVLRVYDKREKP